MTKELSKQLCELAGIEAKYTININIGDLDIHYHKFVYDRKFTLIRNHIHELTNDPNDDSVYSAYIGNIKEEYPDFGEPENFVKLLEVLINSSACISLGKTYNEVGCGCGLTFLDAVIDFLNQLSDEPEYMAELKQALQEQNWRYYEN